MKNLRITVILSVLYLMLIASCQNSGSSDSLKTIFSDQFMVGTALNAWQIEGKDSATTVLVEKHFNTLTAENIMKWEKIHPKPGTYTFEPADQFVGFCEANDIFIVGHTLVWNSQTPEWVFQDAKGNPCSRETLLKRMKDHIFTVVGRYKGKVHGWDVLNEAFNEEGEYRKTRWFNIIGPDYIDFAFQWAHEADPEAELYYNDYNMWYAGKRDAVVKMVEDLQSKDIPIHGIGLQGHWGLDYPPLDELDTALDTYANTGLTIMVTEHEVNILPLPDDIITADISANHEISDELNPYPESLPDSMHTVLSSRYVDIFRILLKYQDSISRVTFWGVHDGYSWTNYWPVHGRSNYPLLFDREYQPKPAFHAIVQLANEE